MRTSCASLAQSRATYPAGLRLQASRESQKVTSTAPESDRAGSIFQNQRERASFATSAAAPGRGGAKSRSLRLLNAAPIWNVPDHECTTSWPSRSFAPASSGRASQAGAARESALRALWVLRSQQKWCNKQRATRAEEAGLRKGGAEGCLRRVAEHRHGGRDLAPLEPSAVGGPSGRQASGRSDAEGDGVAQVALGSPAFGRSRSYGRPVGVSVVASGGGTGR